MYTVDTALDSLRKYDISETDLLNWEKELHLEIPVDEYGRKQYSPHHINLFKNIKKHIALGRTISEIRQIISLPPLTESKPKATRPAAPQIQPQMQASQPQAKAQAAQQPIQMPEQQQQQATVNAARPAAAKVITKSPYASLPKRPAISNNPSGAANVVSLVQRLTKEKDQLYKKLLETEKLNSHLYSANSLFHKKVKDMTAQIHQLRENLKEDEKFKLLDDKAKLHKQLIASERQSQAKDEEAQKLRMEIQRLQQHIHQQEDRIATLSAAFNPAKFQGDWVEEGQLVEVAYDNFGINIDSERVRLFRISDVPERIYGQTAIISTSYQYETNSLWKRTETLSVSYIDENTLTGELVAEYILDGVPVAQALYRVTCRRNR